MITSRSNHAVLGPAAFGCAHNANKIETQYCSNRRSGQRVAAPVGVCGEQVGSTAATGAACSICPASECWGQQPPHLLRYAMVNGNIAGKRLPKFLTWPSGQLRAGKSPTRILSAHPLRQMLWQPSISEQTSRLSHGVAIHKLNAAVWQLARKRSC